LSQYGVQFTVGRCV